GGRQHPHPDQRGLRRAVPARQQGRLRSGEVIVMSASSPSVPSGARRNPASSPRRALRRRTNTVIAIAILVVLLFPLYWMLNIALQPGESLASTEWFPLSAGWDNFHRALSSQGGSVVTSLVVSLGAVVVCLVLAAPAAYGLAQFGLRGSRTVVFGTLIT